MDDVYAARQAPMLVPRQPWYKVLYIQVLIAIALGVLLGYVAPETANAKNNSAIRYGNVRLRNGRLERLSLLITYFRFRIRI